MRQINLDLFRERTGITHQMRGSKIVSLRQISKVKSVELMSRKYLTTLLHSVTLEENPEKMVYEGCEIELATVDPRMLFIGQTFVERQKCASLLEAFPKLFTEYCLPTGFSRSIPLIVYGETREIESAVAHYVPPIVEAHKHKLILLDGIHRNYIVMAAGSTIDSIIVRNPCAPFPCDIHDWSRVTAVDEKPPREERFRNLRRNLFRNFNYSGIDG